MSADPPRSLVRTTGDHAPKRRKLSHRQSKLTPSAAQPRPEARIRSRRGSIPDSRLRLKPCPPRRIRSLDHRGQVTKSLPSSSGKNASSNSTTPPVTPGVTATPDSSVKMSTAKSLLDQIWARNRNQHRAQSWWKSLGMLRKAITRVVAMNDAERSLRLQSNAGVGATEAKEVRKRFEQESQIRRERDLWFDWMREVLVPRAYVGFTGLVSDSQFAALGVVLVGILADVMSVVGAPTRSVDEDDRGEQALHADKVTSKEQGGARVLTATSLKVTGLQSGEVVERIYHSDDVGEVVERTKLEISRDQVRLPARKDVPTADDGSAAYVTDSPSVGSDGSKGTGVSDAVLNFKANRGDRDRKKQKQDPKLKPLGNKDVESESKSKKKKKKNAIDDMFAGFL